MDVLDVAEFTGLGKTFHLLFAIEEIASSLSGILTVVIEITILYEKNAVPIRTAFNILKFKDNS
jgi:hypothetical protein